MVSFRVVLAEGSSMLLLRRNSSLSRDLAGAVASVLSVDERYVVIVGVTDGGGGSGALTARRRRAQTTAGGGCVVDVRALVSAPTTDAAALSVAATAAQAAVAASLASDTAFGASAWQPFVARYADAVGTASALADPAGLLDVTEFKLTVQAFNALLYTSVPSVVPNATAAAGAEPTQAGAALFAALALGGSLVLAAGTASCLLRVRLAATAREAEAKLRGGRAGLQGGARPSGSEKRVGQSGEDCASGLDARGA